MSDDEHGAELRGGFGACPVFFALATAGTVGHVITYPAGGALGTAGAVVAIVAPQVVYFFTARPAPGRVRANTRGAWVFATVAVPLFVVALVLNRWSSLALFALVPEMFLAFSFGYAAALIVALNAASAITQIAIQGETFSGVVETLGISLFVVVFSLFFGSRLVVIAERSDERLRMIELLRERQATISALSAARGAEQERTRIAREMHDTLAQGFTSIITLGHAAHRVAPSDADETQRLLDLITRTAQENLTESRRLVAALSPARLDGATLVEAVERTVASFVEETGVEANSTVTRHPVTAAPAEEVVALRVVQEGLTNVRRHAGAHHVCVGLAYGVGALVVSVADDGAGFDAAGSRAGFGLAGMRARAEEIGGTVEITSAPGEGTTVTTTVPIGASS